jgi:hypothetical protein
VEASPASWPQDHTQSVHQSLVGGNQGDAAARDQLDQTWAADLLEQVARDGM